MIKELIRKFLTALGLHRLFRFLNKNRFVIITYHGITSAPDDFFSWTTLPVDQFSRQIDYLKSNYTILPLETLITQINSGQPLPPNAVAITFDDGFENNFSRAFPILQSLQVPATIFVATDYTDTKDILWTDELYLRFKKTVVENLDLTDIGLKNYDLQTLSLKEQAHAEIVEHLKKLQTKERLFQLDKLREKLQVKELDETDKKEFLMLSREQIDAMHASSLISFGAHSAHHEILSRLNEAEQEKEIHSSCSALRSMLGLKRIAFAYPNGNKNDYNETTINILKRENIFCALTNIEGYNSHIDSLYELKRINIDSRMTQSCFKLAVSGFQTAIRTT